MNIPILCALALLIGCGKYRDGYLEPAARPDGGSDHPKDPDHSADDDDGDDDSSAPEMR